MERRAYEDSLLGVERERVLAEAMGDSEIEDRAFAGGYTLTPTPELRREEPEMVAPTPAEPLFDDRVFYFNKDKEKAKEEVEMPVNLVPSPEAEVSLKPREATPEEAENAPELEITLPSSEDEQNAIEAELSPETWDLIRYAIALSKEAIKEVKTKKYKKEENIVASSNEGNTYSFPMEHPDVRK